MLRTVPVVRDEVLLPEETGDDERTAVSFRELTTRSAGELPERVAVRAGRV